MDWKLALLPALLLAYSALSGAAEAQGIPYPQTRTVDQTDDYFGTKVADPYRWLEDANSPETAAWVEAQNRITYPYLNSLPQREKLLARLTKLYNYTRYTAPFKEGGQYFFFKNDGLQNQAVMYVQPTLTAEPRVLLDPNTLSKDGTIALNGLAISEDGKSLAYALSSGGSDWQEIHVRDVATATDKPDLIKWVKFSGISWTHDHKGFFYSRYPEPDEKTALQQLNKNQKLYYHRLGTPQSEDILVYERPDQPDWGIGGSVTEDGRYLLLYLSEGTARKNRLYYMDLKNPNQPDFKAQVVKLFDDFDGQYSHIGHDGTVFYIETTAQSPRGRLLAVDLRKPERAAWKTLIAEGKDSLQSVSLVGNTFYCDYLHDAYSQIRAYDLSGKLQKTLTLPTLGAVGGFGAKRTETEFFYSFTSFLYPTTIFRYDVKTGESTIFRKPEIAFDASRYETKQVFYKSKDGTKVPMFLTYKKGLKLDGNNPTYLYAYGGFNISLTPYFSTSTVVWLEQGGVFAMPNLRGGGEYGEEWHEAGTKLKKQNVFDDFIAAAEYLIKQKYTQPKRLAIAGGSNGGLLIGAVLNQRPDLFGVALPAVGVMDMLRFHKFTIGWAWKSDYGSSENPAEFRALYAYSPLHNIKSGTKYPATMITTADHDDRVVPAHSFKYAAALQAAQAGTAPVLIRIETKAGHGAGKPTAKILEELTDQWAFVLENMGIRTVQ